MASHHYWLTKTIIHIVRACSYCNDGRPHQPLFGRGPHPVKGTHQGPSTFHTFPQKIQWTVERQLLDHDENDLLWCWYHQVGCLTEKTEMFHWHCRIENLNISILYFIYKPFTFMSNNKIHLQSRKNQKLNQTVLKTISYSWHFLKRIKTVLKILSHT